MEGSQSDYLPITWLTRKSSTTTPNATANSSHSECDQNKGPNRTKGIAQFSAVEQDIVSRLQLLVKRYVLLEIPVPDSMGFGSKDTRSLYAFVNRTWVQWVQSDEYYNSGLPSQPPFEVQKYVWWHRRSRLPERNSANTLTIAEQLWPYAEIDDRRHR